MKTIDGNKAAIIGMAVAGELEVGEVVYSEVNKCSYKIERITNHQGTWIGVCNVEDEK